MINSSKSGFLQASSFGSCERAGVSRVGNAPRQADSLSNLALLALLDSRESRGCRGKKGGRARSRARLRNLSREMHERQEPTASPPIPTSQNPANNETIPGTDGIPSIAGPRAPGTRRCISFHYYGYCSARTRPSSPATSSPARPAASGGCASCERDGDDDSRKSLSFPESRGTQR